MHSFFPNYKDCLFDDVQNEFKKNILLITATDLETKFLHNILNGMGEIGAKSILKCHKSNYTYYLGIIGFYKIVHIQCSMGSATPNGSAVSVTDSISFWDPQGVIMIGICYGINELKQNIGDVVISESVIPYQVRRVSSEKNIPRGGELPSGAKLTNRLKNIRNWHFETPQGHKTRTHFGRVLSGEELIDNLDYRNEAIKLFPEAIGGEMEGVGLYAACLGKVEWILVKGVCDFADGNKNKNKEFNQSIAVNAAIDFCSNLFYSKIAFEELGVKPTSKEVNFAVLEKVLFDRYEISKEPFYYSRKVDEEIFSALKGLKIWLYGEPGSGKTSIILRSMLQSSIAPKYINLSSAIGGNSDSIFRNIYNEISLTPLSGLKKNIDFSDFTRSFINVLLQQYSNQALCIYLDEFPFSETYQFQDFTQKLVALISNIKMHERLKDISIHISSIRNPLPHLGESPKGIHEYYKFIDVSDWSKSDIIGLIDLISGQLNIFLPQASINILLEKEPCTPRFIKTIIRNTLFSNESFDAESIQKMIKSSPL
jgi:nucleoside phosphorylase